MSLSHSIEKVRKYVNTTVSSGWYLWGMLVYSLRYTFPLHLSYAREEAFIR